MDASGASGHESPGVEKYVHQTSLDRGLLELVKARASLINGCACCGEMHTKVARTSGSPGRGRRQ